MENLISLIIDLLGALFGENGKKKNSSPANRPDPSRPRPQIRPTTWEDELRRLLEGQNQPPSQPPTPRQPSPPPLVTIVRSPPTATPAPAPISPTGRPQPVISPPALPRGIQIASRDLAPLSESQQAYARASQIDKAASARVAQATMQPVLLTTVKRAAASPELVQAVSFFRNARSARQAVIATVILGPPRAFEAPAASYF